MVEEQRKNGSIKRCKREFLIQSAPLIQRIEFIDVKVRPRATPGLRPGKLGGLIYDAKGTLDSTKSLGNILVIVGEGASNFSVSKEQDSEETLKIGWSLRT